MLKQNLIKGSHHRRAEMREKLARLTYEQEVLAGLSDEEWARWKSRCPRAYDYRLSYADQILTLLREEIEKVEKERQEESTSYGSGFCNGFEYCLQKILSLFKEHES
jgi:hypothetical protein